MKCKFCGSDEIGYVDNAEMCESYDWYWYCVNCNKIVDEDDDTIYDKSTKTE